MLTLWNDALDIFPYFFGWLHPQLLKSPWSKPASLKPLQNQTPSLPFETLVRRHQGLFESGGSEERKGSEEKVTFQKVGEILLVWPIPSMGLMYSPTFG